MHSRYSEYARWYDAVARSYLVPWKHRAGKDRLLLVPRSKGLHIPLIQRRYIHHHYSFAEHWTDTRTCRIANAG